MPEATALVLARDRLSDLAMALSDYALRYGLNDPARNALAELEDALSAYVLQYGLTEQARRVMTRHRTELDLAGLLHEANEAMHEATAAPRLVR